MKHFKTKILSNKKIAGDHYALSFKSPQKVKPGQFFNIKVNDSQEPFLRRPFSAHKIEKGKIGILYKVVGKATEILSARKKGNVLDVLGPLGNGFIMNPISPAILVAGGHGVAPLYALAKAIRSKKHKVTVFIGGRTKKQIISDRELRKLGAKVHIATEDGSKGYKGFITGLLNNKLQKTRYMMHEVKIFACGPKGMLKALSNLARDYGIPCQVSLEEYMACGIGTCLGCAVKTKTGYKLVCKDGPVFNAKDILWQ